jgi:phosphoesterase RecJ-like protein
MTTVTVPDAIIDRIRAGQRFVITSHMNPDGDAVGTAIGLARLLRRVGKSARVWLREPIPELYRAAVGSERVHTGIEPPAGYPDDFDTGIALECPTLDRSGLEEFLGQLPLINIDHHLGNGNYGVANWVDSAAPAVGEMVLRIARTMRLELDTDAANALYLALETDTGGFRFSNTTSRAFEAAAILVQEGASPELISQWLYESRPLSTLRLLGAALRDLRVVANGRVASVLVTQELYRSCEASQRDTEGLIDYPRSIEGVEAIALVRELEDGAFKISLRSRGEHNVESVARRHGGGGHRNAAGFRLEGNDPEAVRDAVHAELAGLLEDRK